MLASHPVYILMPAIYWLSVAVLFHTYVGYFLLLVVASRLRPAAVHKTYRDETTLPHVSVMLIVYNQESDIEPRLRNLALSDYPSARMEFIVISDGSTDTTAARVRSLNMPNLLLIENPIRSGKAKCINDGIARAGGELVVFADCRQSFERRTIRELVGNFADPVVGAVSGSLEIAPSPSGTGSGVDSYWTFEKKIRRFESLVDSCIGCTGAVYAVRRTLIQPLPDDTILDDVVIPMQVVLNRHRVIFEPAAIAYDPQSLTADREQLRKGRTLAGNFQLLFRYPGWLLPSRNRLWWNLISHKYLRLVGVVFLILLFIANSFLLASLFYWITFVGQTAFYLLAVIGLLIPALRWRIFAVPAGFVFLNVMSLKGLFHYLHRDFQRGWK